MNPVSSSAVHTKWEMRCNGMHVNRIWFVTFCMFVAFGDKLGTTHAAADAVMNPSAVTSLSNKSDDGRSGSSKLGHPEGVPCTRCGLQDLRCAEDIARYLPNGIPMFRVQFSNTCESCSLKQIHIDCGAFSSSTLVNPNLFRRLAVGDCLLNNGNPIEADGVVGFEYASNFRYPMNAKRAVPVCGHGC